MLPRSVGLLASGLGIAIGAAAPAWSCRTIERASVGTGGVQGNDDSIHPAISADGRFVAFISSASNLVPNDTNGAADIFVHDRRTRITSRASIGRNGVQGNGASIGFAISANGRFVAFTSEASNLVPGDTNGVADVFVRDRRAGTTRRVSIGPTGVQGNARSWGDPALSARGRFVAFSSLASDLVPGDSNGTWDAFVHNRRTGTTQRASLGSGGVQGNGSSLVWDLSADSRFVGFYSAADQLVPDDDNGVEDAFVRDRRLGTTQRVSVGPRGAEANGRSYGPALSASGRFTAFGSLASNLVPSDTNGAEDIFVHDRRTRTTSRASVGAGGAQANRASNGLAISADGSIVAFGSEASNLVPDDTNEAIDVFVRDRSAGTTERVSVGAGGVEGNGGSVLPDLSADGRTVVFQSGASNLVPGDTSPWSDIFVCTR